jgi:hypothetical protein
MSHTNKHFINQLVLLFVMKINTFLKPNLCFSGAFCIHQTANNPRLCFGPQQISQYLLLNFVVEWLMLFLRI